MANQYFTQHQVELLEKWAGQKSVKNNPEQDADYDELKRAYNIVGEWAEEVKTQLFPDGYIKIRRSPVNQGGNFFSYLWAKIYPTQDAPTSLAYTVHLSTDDFGVK